MEYTTYIEDPKQKPGQFDWLKIHLDRARTSKKPVYVLAMSRENYPNPERVIKKLKEVPGVCEALQVNGTIDCITTGSKEEASRLAKELHTITEGETIACVEYNGENMMSFYVTLSDTISIARERNEPWHMYNPKTDSLDAILE